MSLHHNGPRGIIATRGRLFVDAVAVASFLTVEVQTDGERRRRKKKKNQSGGEAGFINAPGEKEGGRRDEENNGEEWVK